MNFSGLQLKAVSTAGMVTDLLPYSSVMVYLIQLITL
jgi:hypothetical protein